MEILDAPDRPPISTRVMEIMATLGEPLTVQRVSDVIEGATARQVANCMSQMKQRGLVEIAGAPDVGLDQIPRARWKMTRSGEQHFARITNRDAGPPPPGIIAHTQTLARDAAVSTMVREAVEKMVAPAPSPAPKPAKRNEYILRGDPMIGADGAVAFLADGTVECVISAVDVERISQLWLALRKK